MGTADQWYMELMLVGVPIMICVLGWALDKTATVVEALIRWGVYGYRVYRYERRLAQYRASL